MKDAVNLIDFQARFGTEQACIDYLAEARWHGEPVCPRCGHQKVYEFKARNLYKCAKCRQQFTVRIGTIFEESRLPLHKWFLAIYLLTSLSKGLSSVQLSKYLGITQKSAWFMLQRIRYAINSKEFQMPLNGIVEADETYMGGKRKGTRGRGAAGKTPVFGMAQRKGEIKCAPVENVKSATVVPMVRDNVEIGSMMMTDEFRSYRPLRRNGYEHQFVRHGRKEYVKGDAHTNTIEGFWSHLKRGIEAIYVQVSKKHLAKYCDEYVYRYNMRTLTDFEKFSTWFSYCRKRLTYASLIA